MVRKKSWRVRKERTKQIKWTLKATDAVGGKVKKEERETTGSVNKSVTHENVSHNLLCIRKELR